MTNTWENDSCETVQACYSVYHVAVAAALWCGVSPDQVEKELQKAVPVGQANALGRATLRHPYLKCLEPRMRAIHAAVDSGELSACREDGKKTDDHVAYERRHVYGLDLKEWAKSISPSERPEFLFDDIERSTHPEINADTYRALKADHDNLLTRLEEAKTDNRQLRDKYNDLERLNQALQSSIDKMKAPGDRAETTYLNILGALLELMLSKSPGGQEHSIFTNQAAIIQALLGYYEGKQGIAARTLEEKFALAKRALGSS